MGVDLMPFMVNTARARFLRLALEFYDGQSNSSMRREASSASRCIGTSCAAALFPIACAGSGLRMPWVRAGSFNKCVPVSLTQCPSNVALRYISVYPINHFDDAGSEALVRGLLPRAARLPLTRRRCARRSACWHPVAPRSSAW
jgi:hypothetical protein